METVATVYACMAAFHRALGGAVHGGEVVERADVVAAVAPGLAGLLVANAAVYRDPASLIAALPVLAGAYEQAGVERSLVWAPSGDGDAHEALVDGGYARVSESPAMALELAGLPDEDDPLEDWTAAPDPAELAQVIERSYGLADGAVGAALDGWLPGSAAYVARLDGRPVSCLTLLREGDDAGVFLVGTVPEARGRAFARRLLLRALHDARAQGARSSTLQSSRLGYAVYRRLGYAELDRVGMWERGR